MNYMVTTSAGERMEIDGDKMTLKGNCVSVWTKNRRSAVFFAPASVLDLGESK